MALALLLPLIILGGCPRPRPGAGVKGTADKRTHIINFNVGQSDAMLVIHRGRSMLYDAGATVSKIGRQNFRDLPRRMRELLGHTTLDYFVVSHYHQDHIGLHGTGTRAGMGDLGLWGLVNDEGVKIDTLVDRGFFRVVYGGAQEGAYLCQHDGVDEIHITGSDKTHDAIVFGVGPEGAERKKNRQPVNTRRITSELGNVSPIIVVPGPWKEADLAFQGVNIASSLTNNAGFNCNATRVILTHAGWDQRAALLERVRSTLDQAPTREAYYPGAEQRFDLFTGAHREGAEELGRPRDGHLPWTFIPGLDAAHEDDPCFTTEAFCSVFGELPLEAASPAEYIAKAVEFCNDKLWGTLNAAIVVHPDSLKDPAVAKAVEQAVADLRYGAVAVNHWPALAYALVTTTWGAFPGHDAYDIQSGVGVVHNTFLFDHPQKTVVRGPFRMPLKPPWFVTNKNSHRIARKLYEYEAAPSLWKIPGIVIQSLKG